jgi:phosphoserine phosphatase
VSIAVQVFPLKNIQQLTLAELISPTQQEEQFPCGLSIENNRWLLPNAIVNGTVSKNGSLETASLTWQTSAIELVVFSDISISLLSELITSSKLILTGINAINERNNRISYRFLVLCDDLAFSRRLIAEFTLANHLEAALIENAPLLSQAGVLVMDMDSTTIEIECIDEIAVLAGVGEQVAAVTEQAMQGELDFAQSLHQRVATLAGSPETILADVAKNIPLMNGLETLIKELKVYNWKIAIASGGFTYFADHLKQLLDLDAAHANTLEIVNGSLTGKVLGNVVDAQAKADCLLALQAEYQLPLTQTVAMGDGANDLVMMNAAHLGVAFHAKPLVLAKADCSISHLGLDCLLHWLA